MMAIPSPIKIKKDGVEYISSVDRVQYTIRELVRAAQKETAKLLRKRLLQKIKKLPGMKRAKRPYKSTQYWVRKRDLDMQIGFKHDSWYGVHQELGTSKQPRRDILRKTVTENINEIRKIQGVFLSAIDDENKALGLINEAEDKDQGEEM